MTFAPHPVKVLQPEKYLPYIISLPHRLKLLEEMGVNACVVVRFSKRFAQIPPEAFLRRYVLRAIAPREIFVGEDFRFGKGREGSAAFLKEAGKTHGFKVHAVKTLKSARQKIGSTGIRHLIADGRLREARKHLGRPVSVLGQVIRGDGRGRGLRWATGPGNSCRGLGFPTANLKFKKEVIPPVGVYAVFVWHKNKRYAGMANVGVRPSFKKKSPVLLEVHLFGFKKNIYGQDILVEFIRKIRDEKTFFNQAQLIAQLARDEKKARRILA